MKRMDLLELFLTLKRITDEYKIKKHVYICSTPQVPIKVRSEGENKVTFVMYTPQRVTSAKKPPG